MLLEELKDYYKTWANLTRKLELGTSTYQRWREKGYIPYPSQLIIQDKTKYRFRACKAHCGEEEVNSE